MLFIVIVKANLNFILFLDCICRAFLQLEGYCVRIDTVALAVAYGNHALVLTAAVLDCCVCIQVCQAQQNTSNTQTRTTKNLIVREILVRENVTWVSLHKNLVQTHVEVRERT